jgi:hypothetical protein
VKFALNPAETNKVREWNFSLAYETTIVSKYFHKSAHAKKNPSA